MSEEEFEAEYLRAPHQVSLPDPRTTSFVRWDLATGGMRPVAVVDYHKSISELTLHAGVPEDVRIQFETAKNLFLYAWFVYRFHAVAELLSLTCLEFGLRERFESELRNADKNRKEFTLKTLLRYAVDCGVLKNEGFQRWHDRASRMARTRYEFERTREMIEKNLGSIILDDGEVEITDKDRSWNLIEVLVETLPPLRNMYAHGSGSIHNQVRGTLELTSEILNQVFPRRETEAKA